MDGYRGCGGRWRRRYDEDRLKVEGEKVLARRPGELWSALHNPDSLSRAILGGGIVRENEAGVFSVAVEVSVMGVKARYEGEVRFVDETLDSYCRVLISGEGPLGPVSGEGEMFLSESGNGTLVKYDFEADVGGGMGFLRGAALGGVAKKMVEGFLEGICAG